MLQLLYSTIPAHYSSACVRASPVEAVRPPACIHRLAARRTPSHARLLPPQVLQHDGRLGPDGTGAWKCGHAQIGDTAAGASLDWVDSPYGHDGAAVWRVVNPAGVTLRAHASVASEKASWGYGWSESPALARVFF